MKEGWDIKTIEETCDILDKYRKPITKRNRIEGEIPYYGATGVLSYVNDHIFNEDLILLGEDGAKWESGAKSAFKISGKTWVNNHAHVLRPDRNILLDDWLVYNLNFQNLLPYVSGMTVPKLNQGNLKKIAVPIPNINVQQQIVQILDQAFEKIDRAIANIQQNIKNAEELFQSKLNEVFSQKGDGWEEKKLGEVCENLDRKRIPITKSKREPGEIPYYGASGIVDYVKDYLFDEELLLVSEDGANLLARTYPIAFSISGKTWVNNHAHVLRFQNHIEQKFIELYLNSITLVPYVSGMAQPKLNQQKLNSIPVPETSLKEKKILVENIMALKHKRNLLVESYNNKVSSLQELKKSLLEKAFKGELIKAMEAV